MADTKVSDLPAVTTPAYTDEVPIAQAGVSKKTTWQKIVNAFFCRADATRTFTSNTSSQALFTSPANGRITLPVGLYKVEGLLQVGTMSATSGNLLINLLGAGTATVGAWLWRANGVDGATGAAAATSGSTMVTSTSPASIVTAGTGTAATIQIYGTFEVTAAGTLIPSMTLVTAAAAVLAIGSFLQFTPMGGTSETSLGPWD